MTFVTPLPMALRVVSLPAVTNSSEVVVQLLVGGRTGAAVSCGSAVAGCELGP